MITFTVILTILIAVGICAAVILAIAGGAIAGVGLVFADVVIGLAPFVGIFLLIKWLLTKRV